MVKVIVIGAGGRMGGRIITLGSATEGIELVGAVESPGHPLVGKDVGEYLGLGVTGVAVSSELASTVGKADVVIDFSHHNVVVPHLKVTAGAGKATVIGTTGLTNEERDAVRDLSRTAPVLLAPNMSVGVNVLFKVLADVSRILGDDYDVEIVEAHHNQKKDAPSGTAVRMAQIIAESLRRDLDAVAVYERKGMIGARPPKEIGIQTLRAGDIVGEHNVLFGGMGERLEFIHRAHSRDNFARGALRAAKWIAGRKPGFYDMQDVLGLKST